MKKNTNYTNICHIVLNKIIYTYISEFGIILICGRVITVGPHPAL